MGIRSKTVGVAGTTRTSVELLLAENVANLGSQGDIVRVKPGYARNFLLPQGLATVATDHNRRMVEQHKVKVAELQAQQLKDLRETASAISKYSVTIEANANKDGQLYGSVVQADISKSLTAAGYAVDADHVKLEGPLKELGMYTVKIQLHTDVKAEVKVWVVPAAAAAE